MQLSENKKDKLYIILTLRHKNIYGDEFCLFWGYDESSGGYTGNPYHAHRYTYEEAKKRCDGKQDILIDIDMLGLDKEYKQHNKNVLCFIEKATLNRLLGFKLRRMDSDC